MILYNAYHNSDVTTRSMFASNFPVDKINGNYSQWVTIVTESINEYCSDEQQMIMSQNALTVYRL